ncbi:MAG: metal-sensitive transcriptional regulator [Pseudomonadota bacterium]
MHDHKDAALARLKKIEGQVRGIAKMIDEDRYCVDVLRQTAAIRAAIKGVEGLILDDHAAHCVETAIRSGDPEDQRAKFSELVGILQSQRG